MMSELPLDVQLRQGTEQVCLHFRLRIVEARRAPSRDLPQASFRAGRGHEAAHRCNSSVKVSTPRGLTGPDVRHSQPRPGFRVGAHPA